jgi:hypothetical protein
MGKIKIESLDGTVEGMTFKDVDTDAAIDGVIGFTLKQASNAETGKTDLVAHLQVVVSSLSIAGVETGIEIITPKATIK